MITFGSDPEFVLMKKGLPVSAIGIVPGDKNNRHKIGKHEYYYDNVLAECAVHYGKSKEEVVGNIRDCFSKFVNLVKPHQLAVMAAINFPISELRHPEALKIGCDPEWCCYALTDIVPDEEWFAKNNLRTAGGHIHIGSKFLQDDYNRYQMVRMLDLFLGIPSIYIDHDPTAGIRKKLYGKAGRFRKPDHGVEYRSLSNFWLISPKLVELIYDICEFVCEFVQSEKDKQYWRIDKEIIENDESWNDLDFDPANCHHCTGYNLKELRKAIDTMDRQLGRKFMDLAKEQMPQNLFKNITEATDRKQYNFLKEWGIGC